VARLVDDGAAMILVDGAADDWNFWTTTPKTSPATRRIPIILISDDPEKRAHAIFSGANLAITPDELIEQLPSLLAEMARVPDAALLEQLDCQCRESLPEDGRLAIERFNAGEYYKQHDLFEAMWIAESGPVRDLYRAVLQVGIAYYQITLGNARGALKMLLRSVQWLTLLPDVCQGIDVAQLRVDAAAVRAELERVGEEGISQFDRTLLKGVRLVKSDSDH
jgi:predicted metal-dependent hydrolase